MSNPLDNTPNLAIFCDFENVALGVREVGLKEFDINLVLSRLLDKGNIVVKKAYSDWTSYKASRRSLHEASFELIEVPHVSISGKNSADIRLVVDALDLCYTKHHIDIFVIVSGDSDFSPLVTKLRENNKKVVGLGVKNSTSRLLIETCDEFIYYDDLVRGQQASPSKSAGRGRSGRGRGGRGRAPDLNKVVESVEVARPSKVSDPSKVVRPQPEPAAVKAEPEISLLKDTKDPETRRVEALEMVLKTVDALFRDRDDNIWGSVVKQTIKRKQPGFSETFHGYRNFTHLLEDARERGLLELQKDEKSGGYLIVGFGPKA